MNKPASTFLACTIIAFTLRAPAEVPDYPPKLPGGVDRVTLKGHHLLEPGPNLKEGVQVARQAPRVTFLYYPGQDYPGHPWSVWGDGSVAGGVYYSAIGDHLSPEGNAFVFAYDHEQGNLKTLLDLRSVLKRVPGHYTPGKIHSRIEMGRDGWLYFSTHRGSTKVAFDPANHYRGDWILRHQPDTGVTEIVAQAPLPMQCLPAGVLDPQRLIFYAGTQDGLNEKDPSFLAFDLQKKEVLYSDEAGFSRAIILAQSTGKVYFHPKKSGPQEKGGAAPLRRFDPTDPKPPEPIRAAVGLRAATTESSKGLVYTIDHDRLWAFNTRTEKAEDLGPAAVASQTYTTSIDLDPRTERYLYYVPGAHGGGDKDGTPVVQYDVKTRTRKVIAFLHPALRDATGFIPQGTFSSALSEDGGTLFITWNGNRGYEPSDRRIRFNTCALTVIEIPETERRP